MKIEAIDGVFSIFKVKAVSDINFEDDFVFACKTDNEISVVARNLSKKSLIYELGWKCFRIAGQLDFSLTGVLAKISAVLADEDIGIFAVSTYDTDYIFVKEQQFERAVAAVENIL